MKKAILAVSFGTSYAEAEESCIRPVEEALRQAFPEYEVRRAFTSRKIIKKLRKQGVSINNEAEELENQKAEGYEQITVVPTHILHGIEYELVKEAAGSLPVSEPLLESDVDIAWMAELLSGIAAEERQPLLMMGHGTEHAADETYAKLREKLPENVYIACVEGEHSLEKLLPELMNLPEKKLTLMPLMLVAGDHARNDMAGEEDSWKSMLEKNGFELRIRMQGLGALEEVQKKFVSKANLVLYE